MKTIQSHNLGLWFLKIQVGEGKNGLWTCFFLHPHIMRPEHLNESALRTPNQTQNTLFARGRDFNNKSAL